MIRRRVPSLRLYVGASEGIDNSDRELQTTRHATWLELFFDLVFVVAIAQLAHLLHNHLNWEGIVGFGILFIPVWWLWIDFSYYADQFDVERGAYRVVMLGVMFGAIVLSLTVPNALTSGSLQFASVYAALRAVIVMLYVQAWRLVPESQELTARYTLSFAISLAIWIISLLVPPPLRFWLWGIALTIEIANGPITYATIRTVPTQVSHMDERFGLFVIIVLGEAIASVGSGLSAIEWRWQVTVTAILGFVVAVSLWWLYFECAQDSVINRALRSNRKRELLRSFVYGYSHVLVFAGIVATGVGIQAAIETANDRDLEIAARSVLCGGTSLYLLGLSAVQWAAPNSLPRAILIGRAVAILICLASLWWGAFLTPVALLGLLSIVLLGLIQFQTRVGS